MPRPKILDVNEGVGEALFYPYNVLVNKCSGSCNTLNDPMAKMCVPIIIKRVNMKVYNFLMRLNETRNVLWHESCKCVCRLNSSVCNSKQIWNSDTCRCNYNEDFSGIISCGKGYTMFAVIVFFCVFAYFKWFKGKKLYKNKYTVESKYLRMSR